MSNLVNNLWAANSASCTTVCRASLWYVCIFIQIVGHLFKTLLNTYCVLALDWAVWMQLWECPVWTWNLHGEGKGETSGYRLHHTFFTCNDCFFKTLFLAALGLLCCLWALSHRGAGLIAVTLLFESTDSVVVTHGLSCLVADGIFADQVLNPCTLHWQMDSLPLDRWGRAWLLS